MATHPRRDAASPDPIPEYLNDTYWWAYLTPEAIRLFDRPWMTNLILWGNYRRLGKLVMSEVRPHIKSQVVQIGSVYGALTPKLSATLKPGSTYTVVDVASIQLEHLKSKMADDPKMHYLQCDATRLKLDGNCSDLTVLFFLLHELPHHQKIQALHEAWRITRPKGKLVVVDYHRPSRLNPVHWVMKGVLKTLEPFALELWDRPIETLLTSNTAPRRVTKETRFGGLYQKITFVK